MSGVGDSLKQGRLSEAYKDVFTACPAHHAAAAAFSVRSQVQWLRQGSRRSHRLLFTSSGKYS